MSGCYHYTKAVAEIYFPDGYICCHMCPMLETYSRLQCRRTGEYLIDDKGIGGYCPLKFEEETNDEREFEDL